jgi:hypothetical protein
MKPWLPDVAPARTKMICDVSISSSSATGSQSTLRIKLFGSHGSYTRTRQRNGTSSLRSVEPMSPSPMMPTSAPYSEKLSRLLVGPHPSVPVRNARSISAMSRAELIAIPSAISATGMAYTGLMFRTRMLFWKQ